MSTKTPAKPRKVDFSANDWDMLCAMLGERGLATTTIANSCGLSHSQVLYRLKKANIYRADYRNGLSPYARSVIATARVTVDKQPYPNKSK